MGPSEEGKVCVNCKYFVEMVMNPQEGTCHRHPARIIVMQDKMTSAWPKVRGSDFCGEFQRNPKDGEPEVYNVSDE